MLLFKTLQFCISSTSTQTLGGTRVHSCLDTVLEGQPYLLMVYLFILHTLVHHLIPIAGGWYTIVLYCLVVYFIVLLHYCSTEGCFVRFAVSDGRRL